MIVVKQLLSKREGRGNEEARPKNIRRPISHKLMASPSGRERETKRGKI